MPKIAPTSPLYAQFRADFPAQAGQGIAGDLNYSDTIVPVVDMTAAAGEGTLPTNLQTAWDFSTTRYQVTNATTTIVSNAGFWQVGLTASIDYSQTVAKGFAIRLNDGTTTKDVWAWVEELGTPNEIFSIVQDSFVVYLRSGDSLQVVASTNCQMDVWTRQIATLNGDLVNPLGFQFN